MSRPCYFLVVNYLEAVLELAMVPFVEYQAVVFE